MMYIEPRADDLAAFLQSYPADAPVVMLNLLRFREQADYGEGAAEPCSGAEAFMRYAAAVAPLLEKHGARQVWQGRQAAMLIGPDDKEWHLIVLMQYPGAGAFMDMVTSDDYRSIVFHRTAALADSRLIAMQELG